MPRGQKVGYTGSYSRVEERIKQYEIMNDQASTKEKRSRTSSGGLATGHGLKAIPLYTVRLGG
jgi:hypothetical protein